MRHQISGVLRRRGGGRCQRGWDPSCVGSRTADGERGGGGADPDQPGTRVGDGSPGLDMGQRRRPAWTPRDRGGRTAGSHKTEPAAGGRAAGGGRTGLRRGRSGDEGGTADGACRRDGRAEPDLPRTPSPISNTWLRLGGFPGRGHASDEGETCLRRPRGCSGPRDAVPREGGTAVPTGGDPAGTHGPKTEAGGEAAMYQ